MTEKQKVFEIVLKATILYYTFDFVDEYDFDCNAPELISDLFYDARIELKQDRNGIEELEILHVGKGKTIPVKKKKEGWFRRILKQLRGG